MTLNLIFINELYYLFPSWRCDYKDFTVFLFYYKTLFSMSDET